MVMRLWAICSRAPGATRADKFDASGQVFNLKQVADIEGAYAAETASIAPLGAGSRPAPGLA